MGTIAAGFSMSLDAFIAGPGDDVQRVFAWMTAGETDHSVSTGDHEIRLNAEAADHLADAGSRIGAIVSGRRLFDVAGAWGGKHPMDVPVFVVTHSVPQDWVTRESPFTFVTDGVESAVAQARAVAGDKNVGVGGADITQQCLNLGLLDEIGIDLVPALLGDGVRLFDHLAAAPVELEISSVTQGAGVTHLTYRVLHQSI